MIIERLEQNTQIWHEYRKNHLGASESASSMGICPFKKPLKLWREKIGLDTSNFENDAMREGKRLEPIARDYVNRNYHVNYVPLVIRHPTIDYMSASLDGIDLEKNKLIELKCGSLKMFKLVEEGQIPNYYYAQCQHQLECTGYSSMHFGVYIEVNDIPMYSEMMIKRDNDYIEDMLAKQKVFWDCVLNFTPPESGIRKINSERFKYLENKYEFLKGIENETIDSIDKVKLEMITLCEDETSCGDKYKCSKVARKGNIDFMLIPELKSVNCENYRKPPIEYWKIEGVK